MKCVKEKGKGEKGRKKGKGKKMTFWLTQSVNETFLSLFPISPSFSLFPFRLSVVSHG